MENMNELYSDIILEHNQCQENKHPLEDANLSEHGHNPSCGDDITLQWSASIGRGDLQGVELEDVLCVDAVSRFRTPEQAAV